MKRIMVGTLALGAGALIALGALLPPRALALRQPEWRPAGTAWRGAFHVHTNRSDGTGTPEEVAAAAARAGLDFVILTDHGDATRPPEEPRYVSDVLLLDGVEISTSDGHYVAIGMKRAPYPLGGEARDVAEDVARLGGLGVIAHPDSPKESLAWRDWDVPADALEWLNADSQWRDEGGLHLARAFLTYPLRPAETLASLLDRGSAIEKWDAMCSGRPMTVLAGADAHARLGFRAEESDPYAGRTIAAWPSYEASFRTFSLHLVTRAAKTGRAAEDARHLVDALREGRLHTVVDAWAAPAVFEFSARGGGAEAWEGEQLDTADPVVLRVRSNAPLNASVILLRDGAEVHRVNRQSLVYATDRPGVYRAEIVLGGGQLPIGVPWLLSNAIVVRRPEGAQDKALPDATPAPAPAGVAVRELRPDWRVEHAPGSSGEMLAVEAAPGSAGLRYRLGAGQPAGQYAALATPVRLGSPDERLAFVAEADRPMRVSVQLRVPRGSDGERWRRSVYLDATPREVVIPFSEMTPAGATTAAEAPRPTVDSLLFVVDTVNAEPGSGGEFRVSGVKVLGRPWTE